VGQASICHRPSSTDATAGVVALDETEGLELLKFAKDAYVSRPVADMDGYVDPAGIRVAAARQDHAKDRDLAFRKRKVTHGFTPEDASAASGARWWP
jgi:hypothetical protein